MENVSANWTLLVVIVGIATIPLLLPGLLGLIHRCRHHGTAIEELDGIYLFSADNCRNCTTVKQIFQDEIRSGRITAVDVHENPQRAKQLGIFSIPTIAVVKDGRNIKQFSGIILKDRLKDWV